jgi:hypothetical protein
MWILRKKLFEKGICNCELRTAVNIKSKNDAESEDKALWVEREKVLC